MGDLESQLELVRDISNNLDNGVVIIDCELKIVWLNDFLQKKGFKLDDVVGKDFFKIFSHGEVGLDKNSTLDSFKTGKTHKERRKGGDGKEYEIESIPITHDDEIKYVVEISRDLSEFKESEIKLKNVIEHSNQLFYIHDTNHVLSYLSPQCKDIFGYTEEEMKINWTKLTTDNPINEKGFKLTEKAIKTGERQKPYLLELKRKDGKIFFGEINESPLKDESGNVIGLVGSLREVTEQKKAEEKLKYLSYVVEQSSEGMAIADLKGNLIFVNLAWAKMHGYNSPKELIGKHLKIFHNKEQLEKEVNLFNKKVIEKGSWSGKINHMTKDGKIFPTMMDTTLLKDEQGKPFAMVGVAKDITEKKKAEDALRESEEKYRSLIENTPGVVWTSDNKGDTIFISSNVKKIYGYTSEEIYEQGDKLWFDRIHPEDVESVKSSYQNVFSSKSVLDIEYRIQRKDGKWIWLHDTSFGSYEKDGKSYADGSFFDITEQKKAEEELSHEKEFSEKLLETAPGFIVSLDPKGTIVTFNKSAEMISGYKKEEVIGKNWFNLFIDPSDREKIGQVHTSVQKGKFQHFENYITLKNGEKRLMSWSNSPLKDEKGIIQLVIAVGMDVTHEREIESEREKLTAELKRRVEELEKFQRVIVGREIKMVELKKRIKELEEKGRG